MVIRIQNDGYLKRYNNMTGDERASYESRVGEWIGRHAGMLAKRAEEEQAVFQNVLQCSASWNDSECRAFEEGVRLLTALAGKDETWLPDMIYVKSAKRVVRKLTACLEAVATEAGGNTDNEPATGKTGANAHPAAPKTQSVPSGSSPSPAGHQPSGTPDPVRPRHIDQYVHLLPEKVQKHASQYGPLMRELDEARKKLHLLMDDGSASDREAWAKKVVSIDKEIAAIKKELDAGWDDLVKQGRVEVDDLGNARVVPCESRQDTPAGETVELTPEQKGRRRDLRKWLTDTRRGNGSTREEHVAKWQENFREYLTLEPKDKALADQKIMAAMKHYGIEV